MVFGLVFWLLVFLFCFSSSFFFIWGGGGLGVLFNHLIKYKPIKNTSVTNNDTHLF